MWYITLSCITDSLTKRGKDYFLPLLRPFHLVWSPWSPLGCLLWLAYWFLLGCRVRPSVRGNIGELWMHAYNISVSSSRSKVRKHTNPKRTEQTKARNFFLEKNDLGRREEKWRVCRVWSTTSGLSFFLVWSLLPYLFFLQLTALHHLIKYHEMCFRYKNIQDFFLRLILLLCLVKRKTATVLLFLWGNARGVVK